MKSDDDACAGYLEQLDMGTCLLCSTKVNVKRRLDSSACAALEKVRNKKKFKSRKFKKIQEKLRKLKTNSKRWKAAGIKIMRTIPFDLCPISYFFFQTSTKPTLCFPLYLKNTQKCLVKR